MSPHRAPIVLRSFFAGLAENTFQARLGIADPPLLEYIVELLVRFVHADAMYRLYGPGGQRLQQVTDMVAEAEARVGLARREVHRHIGDFTLFWSGVYPEALSRLQGPDRKDQWLDFRSQGKRAYFIASTIPSDTSDAENAVLGRLAHDFDMCAYGLGEVRREWDRHEPGGPGELLLVD